MATPIPANSPVIITSISLAVVKMAALPFFPAARGFLTEISDTYDVPFVKIKPPPLNGVLLSPDSTYLEPTVGQIWPRY